MHSIGYPNFDNYISIKPIRDTNKWVQAARQLYFQIHKGANRQETLQHLTASWDPVEKLDFANWLKYYEEGVPNKYKQAQLAYWGDQNNLGYYLPMPQESKPEMPTTKPNLETMRDADAHPDLVQEEKRRVIEKQRNKIIGRLDSAEKLLRSPEGQMFAAQEYADLIEGIYQLKKKIHLVNKISTSVRLYQDMIVREANVLNGRGYRGASEFLIKIAQEVPSAAEADNPAAIGGGQAGSPVGQSLLDTTEAGPVPGQSIGQAPFGNPVPANISVDVSQSGTPPEVAPSATPLADVPPAAAPLSEGMKEFLNNLNTSKSKDEMDSLEVDEDLSATDFVAEAQAVAPAGLPAESVMEVAEEPAPVPEVSAGKDFDQMFDQSLGNITITDVVSKLEEVAKIFRNREIARQLSMVDLMLDKLGLASLFPTLGEVVQKNLEGNNYALTRLEDILSRLRGTLTTKDIDLQGGGAAVAPEVDGAKRQLQGDEEKEKARKQMRKELENQKLEAPKPAAPTVEMQQDLSQPAQVAPAPVNPPNTPLV